MAIAYLVIGLVVIILGLLSRFAISIIIPLRFLSFFGVGTMYSFPIGIIGLILGIVAARKKPKRAIAITGIILNALIVLLPIAVIIMWGILGD